MNWFSRTGKSASQRSVEVAPEVPATPSVPASQGEDGSRIGRRKGGGGVLGWLKGKPGSASSKPYVAPEIEVKTTRGTRRAKPRASAHAGAGEKAFVREVLGKRANVAAVSTPERQGSGANVQHAVAHDGAAVRVQIGAHEVSAIASHEPVYAPPQRKAPKGLRKIVAPFHDLLPAKTSRLEKTPAEVESGLTGVPSHLITGSVTAPNGAVYGVGPEGSLHRFDSMNSVWQSIGGGDGSHVHAHLGPQPDGGIYALRKSGGSSEVVRVDAIGDDDATVVHRSPSSIVSYAVGGNGTVLSLDEAGKLTRSESEDSRTANLSIYADGIEQKGVSASSLGMSAEGHCFVAGDDGHLYRLADDDGHAGFAAHRVDTAFSNPSDPARFSTLVDLGHTVDHHSNAPTLHALYRKPTGEVFSAYYQGGDFKPGWRFDNAFVVRNMRGIEPIRIPPRDAIQINRDGVQLAVKRGVLYTGREGSAWRACSANGLVALKANPVGLEKSYGLQVLRQADGSERKRVVRFDIQEMHPTLPAGSNARLGTPATVMDAKLSELASGNIRDFAVLESYGATPGDGTRLLYHVDDENRLFAHELGEAGASIGSKQISPATDIGQVRRLSLDNSGALFALAEREGQEPRLYQLDMGKGVQPDWQPLDVPLTRGHKLSDITSTWTGRLRLHVEEPADPELNQEHSAARRAVYQYSPRTGLAPLDRNSAIEAMKAAGGREFHVPGLPAVHVNNEWLGFKSTSRPFFSNCVNWVQSSWAHARALGSAPKVAANWVQHKRKGREGLQPVYQAVADANRFFVDNFAGVRATTPTGQLPSYGAAAQEMQVFRDELLRSVRQILEHIGHSTGFFDANLSPSADFKSKRPKGLTPDKDLLDTVMKWFITYGSQHGIDNSDCRRALGMLRAMRENPHRVYLAFPSVDANAVRSGDKQGLLNARLVRDIQALHQLHDLLNPSKNQGSQTTAEPTARADLQSRFDALKNGYQKDPVVQYSGLSFQNIEQIEDTYDIIRSLSRALNKWSHPLNKTMAGSMAVKGPKDRKSALIKAADKALKKNETLDGDLLAKYGATDAASLKTILTDKRHPEHSRVSTQLKTESREEFKRRFVDTILGMKTKESYVNDRNYAGGIDPFSWVRNTKVNGYLFAGGLLGRDYNLSMEVLGNDPKGGDIGFLLEKARDLTAEVAGGAGYSWAKEHSHGHMHHFMRAAFIAELGGRRTRSGGFQFMIPRDKLHVFADKLFDFGIKAGGAEIKDLRELLASSYERETIARTDTAWEAKLQAFLRAGPTGTTNHAGGHFWGARASLFQMALGVGHEKSTYKMHGRTLEGELQSGAERHDYWSQEAKIAVPGLRFRSWFNFPSNDTAKDQFSIGMGNTDNEFSLGVHNKDGQKCEYRTALLPPINEEQWTQLLKDARTAFPEHASRLDELASWAADKSAFSGKLSTFRDEVATGWTEKGLNKRDLLGNLDLMRWQHGLAMAAKPMYYGIIHEVRAANPSRLSKPASWTRLIEKIRPNADAAADPLRAMNARLDEDPTLKQLIHDLQSTHPTRVKIKYELRPEAMERLVKMQLDNAALPEHEIRDFIRDSTNFRIKSIAALKGAESSNGASVWPVIGVTSGTSTGIEELKGSINFEYDAAGGHAGYTVEGNFASKRKSHRKLDGKFSKQGSELVVMPAKYGSEVKIPTVSQEQVHLAHTLGSGAFGKGNERRGQEEESSGSSHHTMEQSNTYADTLRSVGKVLGSVDEIQEETSQSEVEGRTSRQGSERKRHSFDVLQRRSEIPSPDGSEPSAELGIHTSGMPVPEQTDDRQASHVSEERPRETTVKWDSAPTELTPEEQLEVQMLGRLFSVKENTSSMGRASPEAGKQVSLQELLAKDPLPVRASNDVEERAPASPFETGDSSSRATVQPTGQEGAHGIAEKTKHGRLSFSKFGIGRRKSGEKMKTL